MATFLNAQTVQDLLSQGISSFTVDFVFTGATQDSNIVFYTGDIGGTLFYPSPLNLAFRSKIPALFEDHKPLIMTLKEAKPYFTIKKEAPLEGLAGRWVQKSKGWAYKIDEPEEDEIPFEDFFSEEAVVVQAARKVSKKFNGAIL